VQVKLQPSEGWKALVEMKPSGGWEAHVKMEPSEKWKDLPFDSLQAPVL